MATKASYYEEEEDNILGDDESPRPTSVRNLSINELTITDGMKRDLKSDDIETIGDIMELPEQFFRDRRSWGHEKVRRLRQALDSYSVGFASPVQNEEDEEDNDDPTPMRKPILTTDVAKEDDGYPCPECGRSFRNKLNLGTHRMTHGVRGTKPHSKKKTGKQRKPAALKNDPIPTVAVPLIDGYYTCPECNSGYTTHSGLGIHRRVAHHVKSDNAAKRLWRKVRNDESRPAKTSGSTDPVVPTPTDFTQPTREEAINYDYQEYSIGYIEGHVRTWIDFYCQQTGGRLHPEYVTQRLAKLLGS